MGTSRTSTEVKVVLGQFWVLLKEIDVKLIVDFRLRRIVPTTMFQVGSK